MIFSLKQLRALVENNVITEEKCANLIKYFDNYMYDENSFSEEDRKLIKEENKKGNFDIFSDKDLLNAKRNGVITPEDFIGMLCFLKSGNTTKPNNNCNDIVFNQQDLLLAQKEGIITNEIYQKLLNFLVNIKRTNNNTVVKKEKTAPQKNRYSFENFLYYFGGFMVIIAMGWFMANIAELTGKGGMFVVSLIYFGIFVFFAQVLWEKTKNSRRYIIYLCSQFSSANCIFF